MRGVGAGVLVMVLLGFTRPGAAGAQTRLGLFGGVAAASLGGSDIQGWKTRTGVYGGALVDFRISRVFGLRPGLAWVGKGAHTEVDTYDAKLVIQYFELSVLAQFTLPTTAAVESYLVIGPALGFKAKCDLHLSDQYSEESAACDSPMLQGSLPVRSNDVAMVGGAGVTIMPRNRVSGLVELVYELGLSTIDDGTPRYDVKTRVFLVRAGLTIALAH